MHFCLRSISRTILPPTAAAPLIHIFLCCSNTKLTRTSAFFTRQTSVLPGEDLPHSVRSVTFSASVSCRPACRLGRAWDWITLFASKSGQHPPVFRACLLPRTLAMSSQSTHVDKLPSRWNLKKSPTYEQTTRCAFRSISMLDCSIAASLANSRREDIIADEDGTGLGGVANDCVGSVDRSHRLLNYYPYLIARAQACRMHPSRTFRTTCTLRTSVPVRRMLWRPGSKCRRSFEWRTNAGSGGSSACLWTKVMSIVSPPTPCPVVVLFLYYC